MKQWIVDSRLVSALPTDTRVKVTWRVQHGIFARWLMGLPKETDHDATYMNRGRGWVAMPEREPITNEKLQAQLTEIAERLTGISSQS